MDIKKNEIIYCQPAVTGQQPRNPQEELEFKNEINRDAAKESVLKSLGVAHRRIKAGKYEEFYSWVLEREFFINTRFVLFVFYVYEVTLIPSKGLICT